MKRPPTQTESLPATDEASERVTSRGRGIKIASLAALGAVAVLEVIGVVTIGAAHSHTPPDVPPDPALAAAQTVYTAWKAGDPASASSVAAGSVIADLSEVKWTTRIDPPTKCSPPKGASDEFSCVSYDRDQAARIFLVHRVGGGWLVDGTGECSGIRPHFTCTWYQVGPPTPYP